MIQNESDGNSSRQVSKKMKYISLRDTLTNIGVGQSIKGSEVESAYGAGAGGSQKAP